MLPKGRLPRAAWLGLPWLGLRWLGLRSLGAMAVYACLVPGTARADDAHSSSVDALAFDLERIVDAEEISGWLLDDTAFERIHPVLMESVCRVSPAVRAAALARAEAAAARAGDPQALFAEDGEVLTERVEAALTAQRQLRASRQAVAAAPSQCPFWIKPEARFRGLQSARDRLIVNFDTGGIAQIRQREGAWTIGAGGFGRLLAGYAFTHVSLLAGVEFGGGALLEPGTEPTEFVVNYIPALPLIVRVRRGAWHLDLEGAGVGLFQAGNSEISYGVRAGATLGVSSLRVRGILPWLGLGLATEYHFENSVRPEALYIRGGLRVGGVWAP